MIIIDRATGQETSAGDHYGNPTCGVIAPDESWFVTGGDGLVVFTFDGGEKTYLRHLTPPDFYSVMAMRLETPTSVRFLADPWSERASVWTFAPLTGELHKLHDGPDLREEPYRDEVEF